MFKRLRRRIVLIELAAFLIVAVIIVGTINYNSQREMADGASETLAQLAGNDGYLPPFEPGDEAPQNGIFGFGGSPQMGFGVNKTAESQYTTRYYSAVVDGDGQIIESELTHIASVSEENLSYYVESALAASADEGTVDIYRFLKVKDGGNTVIYFVDCYIAMQYVKYVLSVSVIVSIISMVVVAVFVFFFSGLVVRPIERNYDKQKRFITDAGHELKTPITAICANLEVLTLQNGSNETTDRIKRQLQNLSGLVGELLTLSRADYDAASREPVKRIDISELIVAQAPTFEVPAKEQGKTFSLNLEPKAIVSARETDINRLYSVLADNAVKYCTPSGRIETVLSRGKKGVLLVIRNTCQPIPQEELSHLFERFYRVDSSRSRQTGGYGIGLSVAKAITEKYRGRIRAYNEKDSVCFEVLLPF